jgi:hypothetical protein
MPRIVFVASNTVFHWSRSMPIISQMICSGSGEANSCTKSPSPFSACSSTMALALRRTSSSIAATTFGVKAFWTISRKRVCFGASMLIIEPKNSAISIGMSPMFDPLPDWNSSGLRLAAQMSACRGERPVARSRGNRWLVLGLGLERDRLLGAQLREHRVALVVRRLPELGVAELDLIDGDVADERHAKSVPALSPSE